MSTSPSVISQCPVCRTLLHFSHDDTTIITCTCGTVVNRKEGGALVPKPYTILQQPFDIIQPGTFGKWEDKEFKVLGRFRAWLPEAVFNYWTILFTDGELAYLGEGYGLYSILRKTEVSPQALLQLTVNEVGDTERLDEAVQFLLEKKSLVRKWEIEGELYMPETNDRFTIYDFASATDRQVTIFQCLAGYYVSFEVHYTSYASLRLTNTRVADLPGKGFNCDNCNRQVFVKTYPYAQSCVCNACGTHHVLNNNEFKTLRQTNSTDHAPGISIGSTGVVKGITYECIGHTLKEEDNQYASRWNEYVLYNREEGYAFLSEYNGHWIYLREQGHTPVLPRRSVSSFVFDKEPYQLYNSYKFSIVNAHGEFPYNVFNSKNTEAREFISPPEVWIKEEGGPKGITWFLGEHVSTTEIKDQFNFPDGIPYKQGIGAVEPKFYINPQKLIFTGFIGIMLLTLLHVAISIGKQNRVLLDNFYSFNDSTDRVSFVTPKFHLDKWRSNLEFYISAPVSNDWFELEATLVNAKTGTEYSLEKGVEYYFGYSDGEQWSEGSGNEKAYLTFIPAGEYFLQGQGIRSSTSSFALPNFNLRLTYDVTNNRNLWWTLLFLVCWPVIQYIRTNSIEKKRWYNSPFSPFTYED